MPVASPFGSRCIVVFLTVAAFTASIPHGAFAQAVVGNVRIATDSASTPAPASEAVVVLLDSTGAVVAGVVTQDDGHFTIRAPSSGTYRVLARRIGLAPDSSEKIHLGDSITAVALTLRPFAERLDAVHVDESQRCKISAADGLLALQLWQDVQSALTAAIVTQGRQDRTGLVLTRFTRQVDPNNGRVLRSTTWQATSATYTSFSALPADTLVAHGFVIEERRDVIYYAPDARTLLSDAFARTHCFRPVTEGRHAGLVGLAFDAIRDRNRHAQVSGTLWLDAATRQLRYLEFRYLDAHQSNEISTEESFIATGRLDYDMLSDGTWIIRHWKLRIPVIGNLRRGIPWVMSVWELGGDATNAPEKE